MVAGYRSRRGCRRLARKLGGRAYQMKTQPYEWAFVVAFVFFLILLIAETAAKRYGPPPLHHQYGEFR